MKKLLFIFLLFLSLNCLGGGAGTSGDPYQITTWAELADMNNHLSSYFILMNNLSSATTGYSTYAGSSANSGAGWLPISAFTGNLNGNGKTISDLYINRSSNNVGLISVSSGVITNVGIVNANITQTGGYGYGILIAYMTSGVVSRCYASGSISGISYGGGFIGWMDAGSVNYCYSTASVTGSSYYAGGFSGSLSGSVNYCYSTGSVTGLPGYTGGFSCMGTGGTNCFWDTQTSGQATSARGTGKTTSEMKTLSTFTDASWDIASDGNWTTQTWSIASGSYPILRYYVVPSSNIKTWNGTAKANVKTFNGVAIGNVKSINGLQ